MSVDTPPEPENTPSLRREALLPNERSRGLGTVAVVCTMAGVASGLALATTLMAMQVADSMSVRTCPYSRVVDVQTVDVRPDHGFLGIRYVFHNGVAEIDSVLPGRLRKQSRCARVIMSCRSTARRSRARTTCSSASTTRIQARIRRS